MDLDTKLHSVHLHLLAPKFSILDRIAASISKRYRKSEDEKVEKHLRKLKYLFVFMVRGHVNIIGVPAFTKLATNTTCITRDLYMFTLNVVI